MKNKARKNAKPSAHRFLHLVEAMAISPAGAREKAERAYQNARERAAEAGDASPDEAALREAAAQALIRHYARLAGASAAASSLPEVIPNPAEVPLLFGAALADAAAGFKLQVDLCHCLAALHGYDLDDRVQRYAVNLVAAYGNLGKAGGEVAERLATDAGVRLVRKLARGPGYRAVKRAFAKVGLRMTRRGLLKAIPFGLGTLASSTVAYSTTRAVGNEANAFFLLDRGSR